MKKKLSKTLAIIAACGLTTISASATVVGLELALVVDESGSVNSAEWLLQRNGYAAAFHNAAVHQAIVDAGGIAVSYIQFADGVAQGIGWTFLNSAASANAFGDAITARARFGNSGTAVARAIDFTWRLFGTEVGLAGNGFESTRQVIDVSGDGANNRNINGGTSPAPAAGLTGLQRDAALAAGIDRINGLVISPSGEAGLTGFYQTQVQGGAGSFVIEAADFSAFEATVLRKITAEISNTPLPDNGPGLAIISLVFVGLMACRRKSVIA